MTIWGMRIACWIPKATNTFTICNTYCSSTAAMVARIRLNVTLYVYRLSRSANMYTTTNFSPDFESFPIKPYEFLTPLLAKILYRCLLSTFILCLQMSVIRLGCR
jgi:hypothetical protein